MLNHAPAEPSRPISGYLLAGVCLRAESDDGAVVAWLIDDGVIGEVDVSGVVFVVVWRASEGPSDQIVFVDERVSPEQLHGLLDALQGRLGGPFGGDAGGRRDRGFYQLPIVHERDRRGERVSVLNRVEIVVGPYPGEGEGLGGWQPRVAVAVSELGMAWEAGGGAVERRPFRVSE
jgi:hypothetical protein